MRADEAFILGYHCAREFGGSLNNYINRLRYERMMTKAKYFRDIAKIVYSDDDEHVFSSNTLFKNSMNEIETTCMRISYAYEERAERLKEGK